MPASLLGADILSGLKATPLMAARSVASSCGPITSTSPAATSAKRMRQAQPWPDQMVGQGGTAVPTAQPEDSTHLGTFG
jgi:hypothetical protein